MEGLQKIHSEQMENLIKDAEKVIPPCEKYWYEFNDVCFACLCGYQFNLLTAQVFFPTLILLSLHPLFWKLYVVPPFRNRINVNQSYWILYSKKHISIIF